MEFDTSEHTGLEVVIYATALAATPSIVFTVQGKDEASGTWYDILASAAVTTAAPTRVRMRVSPAITAAANLSVQDLLPALCRITAVHGDSDSITYSVQVTLHP